MNLVIDQGNTSTKIAVFDQTSILEETSGVMPDVKDMVALLDKFPINQVAVCSVAGFSKSILELFYQRNLHHIILTQETPIPLVNHYQTPATLGVDRIAAAVGANFIKPDNNLLIIDMGTAITYDVVSKDNAFVGGNISIGLQSRFRALKEYTHQLPLLHPTTKWPNFIGQSTEKAIMAGIMYGVLFEMEGFISKIEEKYDSLSVFLTGGDSIYFESSLKKPIFAVKNLVLVGLNRILDHNAI